MKKIVLFTFFLLNTILVIAQSPKGMNYQAVARDKTGEVLAEHKISLRVDLTSRQNENKTLYYSEYHDVTTNLLGLFTLVIGEGSSKDKFENVPWANEDIWMAISIKDKDNGEFALITDTKLLAVPYAHHAITASKLVNDNNLHDDNPETGGSRSGTYIDVWSVKGNPNSNSFKDKLGTTDDQDLVIVTNNLERMRIGSSGNINISNALEIGTNLNVGNNAIVGNNLDVSKDVNLNTSKGTTTINGNLVANGVSNFRGDLNAITNLSVGNNATIGNDLIVNKNVSLNTSNGTTTINGTLITNGVSNFIGDLNAGTNLNVGKNATVGNDLIVNKNVNLNVSGGTTTVNGTFTADKKATFGGELTVANDFVTTLNGNLIAKKDAYVEKEFGVYGKTILYNELLVAQPTSLNGLTVQGFPMELKSPLHAVSSVDFDGSLNVDGTTTLNTLNVTGTTNYSQLNVNGPFSVNGATTLNQSLNVENNAQTYLSGNLAVKGTVNFQDNLLVKKSALLNGGLMTSGPATINAQVSGPDYAWGSYPLQVEGSNQGVWITINGAASEANNFVTFAAQNGGIKGCIEGQTLDEKINSFDYIWKSFLLAVDIAQPTAEAVACGLNAPPDAAEIASNGAAAVVAASNQSTFQTTEQNNAGVAFVSGNGDYAEWLPKEKVDELFSYGDIVGVNGGNISKLTKNAANFMVVSKAPIVLGNMPPSEKEKINYEKVAFMGQVPVKVIGHVEIGDYILPSGKNDGFGVAIHPTKMSAKQYREIVGVAWSSSTDQSGFSYINTAIGISQHVIADKLEHMQSEMDKLNTKMDEIVAALESKQIITTTKSQESNVSMNISKGSNSNSTIIPSIEKNDIKGSSNILESIVLLQSKIKQILDAQGINYNLYEQTRKLVNDPNYLAEMAQQGILKNNSPAKK